MLPSRSRGLHESKAPVEGPRNPNLLESERPRPLAMAAPEGFNSGLDSIDQDFHRVEHQNDVVTLPGWLGFLPRESSLHRRHGRVEGVTVMRPRNGEGPPEEVFLEALGHLHLADLIRA